MYLNWQQFLGKLDRFQGGPPEPISSYYPGDRSRIKKWMCQAMQPENRTSGCRVNRMRLYVSFFFLDNLKFSEQQELYFQYTRGQSPWKMTFYLINDVISQVDCFLVY